VLGPDLGLISDPSTLSQSTGGPRLELRHRALGRDFQFATHDNVNMIRPNVEGQELPLTVVAMIADSSLDYPTHFGHEHQRTSAHSIAGLGLQIRIRSNVRRSAGVVLFVDGTPLVSMEPCPVGGPCQKVRERRGHPRILHALQRARSASEGDFGERRRPSLALRARQVIQSSIPTFDANASIAGYKPGSVAVPSLAS